MLLEAPERATIRTPIRQPPLALVCEAALSLLRHRLGPEDVVAGSFRVVVCAHEPSAGLLARLPAGPVPSYDPFVVRVTLRSSIRTEVREPRADRIAQSVAGWLSLLLMGCSSAVVDAEPSSVPAPVLARPVPSATTEPATFAPPPTSEPIETAAPSEEEPSHLAASAEPVTIEIPGDSAVLVVRGEGSTPIVYLHGLCGDPTAFHAWAEAGRRFGTIVSLVGDKRCKHSTRTQWTSDIVALDRRVTKALTVVEGALDIDLEEERRIVIGYSQGSLRAEALAARFPKRYPRAVLIAGPRAPRDESLRESEAVLLMAGDLDARDHLREAQKKLEKRGTTARYIELPGARHGEYGSDAVATMSTALTWLTNTPSPLGT